VISCSHTAPDTLSTTRTQSELPFGGVVMNSVSTPPEAMPKLAPMSVSVGAPVTSFETSCQRVCVPRWKPTPLQLIAQWWCQTNVSQPRLPYPSQASGGEAFAPLCESGAADLLV